MSLWVALASLWLMMAVISLVSGLVMAFLAWCVRAEPKEVLFHWGPSLFAFRALGIRWSFNPLLVGGAGLNLRPNEPDETGECAPDYTRLPLPRRLLLIASTFLGMVLIALVCLTPSRGLVEIGSGFEQTVNVPGFKERASAFFALLATEGLWVALGIYSAKAAAFNLLPLHPLAGYRLLGELVWALRKPQKRTYHPPLWIAVGSLVVVLVLGVCWIVAVYQGLRALA